MSIIYLSFSCRTCLPSTQPLSSHSTAPGSSIKDIKAKLECGQYDFEDAPCLLQIDTLGVYVHKDGRNQNLIESLEGRTCWWDEMIRNNKLCADGFGDFEFSIAFIDKKYFESRDKHDFLFSNSWMDPDDSSEDEYPVKTVKEISLERVLSDIFNITLSSSMRRDRFYQRKMEQALGRKLGELDFNNETLMNEIEAEFVGIEVLKIFGENPSNANEEALPKAIQTNAVSLSSIVMFNDFRVLYEDGNSIFASALRRDLFFSFYFFVS